MKDSNYNPIESLFKLWESTTKPIIQTMENKVVVEYESVYVPAKSDPTDVGYDLTCVQTEEIAPFETKLIDLEIRMAIPQNYWIMVVPRSSTGTKTPLILRNSVGVIDPKYRGNIKACVLNLSPNPFIINAEQRLFQAILLPRIDVEFKEGITSLEDRGGGFGSTGL